MQAEEARSLYERLGGAYSIAVVVDDFIDRIMSDSRLNANPRVDEAHHRGIAVWLDVVMNHTDGWRQAPPAFVEMPRAKPLLLHGPHHAVQTTSLRPEIVVVE